MDSKWLQLQLHLPSRSLLQGSGDSSLEKEFLGAPVGPSVSTPNSQHSSPSRSLSGKCTLFPFPGTRDPTFVFCPRFIFYWQPFPHCCLLLISCSEFLKVLRSLVSRLFLTSQRKVKDHWQTRMEFKKKKMHDGIKVKAPKR